MKPPLEQKRRAKPRSKPKLDDKAQSERFIEAARKLGVEEVGPSFDNAFRAIVSPKSPGNDH
jgi:hypothetical protein